MVRIGRERFAIPADSVVCILDPAFGFASHRDHGAAHLQGDPAHPKVADLHAATGAPAGEEGVRVLVEGPRGPVVVPVDAAEEIRDVAPDVIAPLPHFIFEDGARLFRGAFPDGMRPRLLIDVAALP
jgi:hypothetical protein